MSIAARLTRLPRAFDPDLGAETRALVPGVSGDLAALIEGTAGSSPYLKGLIQREVEWLPSALDDPEGVIDAEIAGLRELSRSDLPGGLRRAKRRLALITALADLSGAWPLEKVTGLLTDFAGLACDLAIKAELAELSRRRKVPEMIGEDPEGAGGLTILAMGKMGAHELNYSSDIDLICLFDETRYAPEDFAEARHAMIRATRAMSGMLSDKAADGYVFRTDLRLRPDPSVTPVCISMDAAERYYESLGRTWERAAYIKARPAAGDLEAGARFLETLRPFVWRKHLDFAAIQDAHDMRLRIRDAKGIGARVEVPGHDMKLGRGGIREIEFFTQTRQLIAGGRDPDLRLRGTVEGLKALSSKGWVPEDSAEKLIEHYRAHREVEHRIQMVNDAQTHRMPQSEDGLARVACLMGTDPEAMIAEIQSRLVEVHGLTEDFFAPDAAAPEPVTEHEFDPEVMGRWTSYPALRSERAAHIFDRLRPELLRRLSKVARPDEALLALDGFLSGLPAGVQLFSLFEANPHLIDLLVDIAGTAPALARYLSQNSGVFDAVIGGDFFDDWPGREALIAQLEKMLAEEEDYERQLDAARRWKKEWHFRIGVHHLRGLIDGATAGAQYADLADAVLTAVVPVVTEQFAAKHGDPPGIGAAVLGMGSLGARRLNAQSDLDIIVIYDPAGVENSDGRRPLASRAYYARLTQAIITAMSAPMSQGRLYEVDMRLRPSGNQGPVATSYNHFHDYQRNEAWVWEHLALTRARVVTAPDELARRIEAFRAEVIATQKDRRGIFNGVADMRNRIAAAKAPAGPFDPKTGAGRLQDIELVAQSGALLAGSAERDVPAGLASGQTAEWLSGEEVEALTEAYHLLWWVQAAVRLCADQSDNNARPGGGAAEFLCRSTGHVSLEALEATLNDTYDRTASIIDDVLARERTDETD